MVKKPKDKNKKIPPLPAGFRVGLVGLSYHGSRVAVCCCGCHGVTA